MSSEGGGRSYNVPMTAILVGVPVLIGATCYYFYLNSKSNNNNDPPTKDSSSTPSSSTNGNKAGVGGAGGDNSNKSKQNSLQQLMQLKQTGNQNFSRKNYDTAIEYYTKAIDLSEQLLSPSTKPEDLAIFYQNRAACNEALGKFDEVVVDCGHAINLRKSYAKAYLRRAKAYDKLGKYDQAMVDAFSANLLEKFQNQASMTLADTIVRASSGAKAAEAIKKHKPCWPSNQVIKTYFSSFTHDPINEKINVAEIRTPEQLEPLYEESKKPENESDPLYLLIKASCLSLMSQSSEAIKVFDQILALSDDTCSPRIKAYALLKRTNITSDLKFLVFLPSRWISSLSDDDYIDYDEHFDQAIRLDPGNPDMFFHKAQIMFKLERRDEALAAINQALSLKRDYAAALALKFDIEVALSINKAGRKLQKILDRIKKAVKQYPNSRDILLMYARILVAFQDYEQADDILIDLIRLHPYDAASYASRGQLRFFHMGDEDCAAPLLRKAIEIDPKLIESYEPLANIEIGRNRFGEAINLIKMPVKHSHCEAEYARGFRKSDEMICSTVAIKRIFGRNGPQL